MREFTPKYWERVWENIALPQEIRPKDIPEIHRIFSSILPKKKLSLIEIGCAPGKWMAYFSKQYNFSVSGVELLLEACKKTVLNMNYLSIPAEIHHSDFFKFESKPYDIVFSAGFIEHFREVQSVVNRIIDLCKPNGGIVITIIPSMTGLNRWISKTFRPHVAAGHLPIDLQELITIHETFGLQTLYANYIGSLQILPPIQKNQFANNYPKTSFVLNLPFRIWNKLVQGLTGLFHIYPKFGWMTNSVLYIGRRN